MREILSFDTVIACMKLPGRTGSWADGSFDGGHRQGAPGARVLLAKQEYGNQEKEQQRAFARACCDFQEKEEVFE